MKITKINSSIPVKNNSFKALPKTDTKIQGIEMKTFMKELDAWTEKELSRAQSFPVRQRIDFIEKLFMIRDIKIQNFKKQLGIIEPKKWWEKLFDLI